MHALARRITGLTTALLGHLDASQQGALCRPLHGPERSTWTYLPRPRPGLALHDLAPPARKLVHRLLAAVLSRHSFAQACVIMALEEVLDADEGGRRDRHSDDYRLVLFGVPADPVWAWRLEGHHLSVTAALTAATVTVGPLFLGANPARIGHRDRDVLAPLAGEEDLARTLVTTLPVQLRQQAVVAPAAPDDLHSGTAPSVSLIEPVGLPVAEMPTGARDLCRELIGVYLDRLAEPLAVLERTRLDVDAAHLAWEGGLAPGEGHYYRLQAPGLLLEYDNTANGANHAHTVLRRPGQDFGEHLLPAHRATGH